MSISGTLRGLCERPALIASGNVTSQFPVRESGLPAAGQCDCPLRLGLQERNEMATVLLLLLAHLGHSEIRVTRTSEALKSFRLQRGDDIIQLILLNNTKNQMIVSNKA